MLPILFDLLGDDRGHVIREIFILKTIRSDLIFTACFMNHILPLKALEFKTPALGEYFRNTHASVKETTI